MPLRCGSRRYGDRSRSLPRSVPSGSAAPPTLCILRRTRRTCPGDRVVWATLRTRQCFHRRSLMTDPDTVAGDATGADHRMVNLTGLGLNAVPPELLVPSTDVTDLTLANNELRAVPEAVYQLPNLRSLNLGGNRLTAIPAGLGRLRHLADLVL